MRIRPIAAAIGLIHAVILGTTFYAWRFSYFWLDDFNVFFWIQRLDRTLWQTVWDCVNPFTNAFRPFGILFYWVFWHLFDLNPLPYHLFAWTLHATNVVLLYLLLSRLAASTYGAALGALLFAFRANFTDIYWSFGTIFELLAFFLTLLALLVHSSKMRFHWRSVVVALLYLLALKSKEMAIVLPALLLFHDVCLRGERLSKKVTALYAVLGLFGLIFGYSKLESMGSASRTDPYFMDLSVLTLGRGYGWYFDRLYGMNLRWGAWAMAAVLLAVLFAYRRERRGLFFLGYVFITLLPVIFLINHRYEFFWYIPFLGISGLVALLAATIEKWLRFKIPANALAAVAVIAFAIIGIGHYRREWRVTVDLIRNQHSMAIEYQAFVGELQNLQLEPDAVVYFRSLPRHFTTETLTSAIQVALHRTDVMPRIVDVFPEHCRYCVQFR